MVRSRADVNYIPGLHRGVLSGGGRISRLSAGERAIGPFTFLFCLSSGQPAWQGGRRQTALEWHRFFLAHAVAAGIAGLHGGLTLPGSYFPMAAISRAWAFRWQTANQRGCDSSLVCSGFAPKVNAGAHFRARGARLHSPCLRAVLGAARFLRCRAGDKGFLFLRMAARSVTYACCGLR